MTTRLFRLLCVRSIVGSTTRTHRHEPADRDDALDPRVERARQVYNLCSASDKLTLHEPVDYTRLTAATHCAAVRWMNQIYAPTPMVGTAK